MYICLAKNTLCILPQDHRKDRVYKLLNMSCLLLILFLDAWNVLNFMLRWVSVQTSTTPQTMQPTLLPPSLLHTQDLYRSSSTSFTIVLINLLAACRSSGFLLCNNFCRSRDRSSSSKIEFFGRGGGGGTGTSFSVLLALLLMYGGSSWKHTKLYTMCTNVGEKLPCWLSIWACWNFICCFCALKMF